jgi:hypothetical protein
MEQKKEEEILTDLDVIERAIDNSIVIPPERRSSIKELIKKNCNETQQASLSRITKTVPFGLEMFLMFLRLG